MVHTRADRQCGRINPMTDTAFPDFARPRRYIRLDTILRLRWLAALGQLAAIFFVVQSLDFDVPIIPCVAIIAASAIVTLALQIAVNPMQRLAPRYAAALLAHVNRLSSLAAVEPQIANQVLALQEKLAAAFTGAGTGASAPMRAAADEPSNEPNSSAAVTEGQAGQQDADQQGLKP